MARQVNPYVAGNPVGDSPAFVGRADVLRDVLHVLRQPQSNAIVLYGQRRIGKTSILQHLAAQLRAEGQYYAVYFDLQNRADWPLERVLMDLARAVAHTLDRPDPDLGRDPETGFRDRWFPDVLNSLPDGCSLVLLFDEFDVLADPEGEQAATAFFPYLHRLLTLDPAHLQFVFVIGRNVDDLANIALSLFKGTPYLRVSLLDRADTADLARLSEDNGTLHWSEDAVERVWQLTHGHPFLTQQLCSHVWERAYGSGPEEVPSVTPADVDTAIPKALAKSRNTLVWLWDGLPPAERVVASALAEAGPDPITQDELERLLHESGVRVVIRELQDAPQLLQDWDLIEPADSGYRFRVELLRQWIAENKPLDRVQEELDRIEPVAENLYQAASRAYQGRRLDEAVVWLRQAIRLNPNHVGANQLLADILLAQGKPDEARQLLEQLYDYQPVAARSRLVQALLEQAQATENDDEQLALYEQVLVVTPGQSKAIAAQSRIWQQRGDAALERKDLETALEAYRKADDAKNIDRVESLLQEEEVLARSFAMGIEALDRKDWERAQRAFAEVIHHRPDYERDRRLAAVLLAQAVLRGSVVVPQRRYVLSLVGMAIAVVVLTLLGGIWAVDTYYFQPREATRQVEATAGALALATAARRTAVAHSATATSDAQVLAATITANAYALDTAATASAYALDTTATASAHALDTTATAQAELLRCRDIERYAIAVAPEPTLFPAPDTVYVDGAPLPDGQATWVVTNTGECPWEVVELYPLTGGKMVTPALQQEGKTVERVEPGERVEAVLPFDASSIVGRVEGEWVVVVNDLLLSGQPHLRLAVDRWTVVVTPTPAFIPTLLPTSTPTPWPSGPNPTAPSPVEPSPVPATRVPPP